jgi:hypothetical protein
MSQIKTFDRTGDFEANNDAEQFLRDRGFSVGSSQGPADRGILFGNFHISKWRGMNKAEIKALHGVIRGEGRNGPLQVILFDSAPDSAKFAFDCATPIEVAK